MLSGDFLVVPPRTDEGAIRRPRDLISAAHSKALSVASMGKQGFIIGADTGVFCRGRHFGKPRDPREAREFLSALSGGWHFVYTGLCIIAPAGHREELVETRVRFRELSPEEIEDYISSGEPLDKAGAYAIQGRAAIFVEEIVGDFFNVVGLPLPTLHRLLRELGWEPPRR